MGSLRVIQSAIKHKFKKKMYIIILSFLFLNMEALAFSLQKGPYRFEIPSQIPPAVKQSVFHNPFQMRNSLKRTQLHVYPSDFPDINDPTQLLSTATTTSMILSTIEGTTNEIAPQPLSDTTNIIIFILGIFPFAWATNEFWRRIAVGLPFGTGSDSVLIQPPSALDKDATTTDNMGNTVLTTIGEDNNPKSSRGRQVLGKGALLVAYFLFGIAAFSIGIAVFSVMTSPSSSMTLETF